MSPEVTETIEAGRALSAHRCLDRGRDRRPAGRGLTRSTDPAGRIPCHPLSAAPALAAGAGAGRRGSRCCSRSSQRSPCWRSSACWSVEPSPEAGAAAPEYIEELQNRARDARDRLQQSSLSEYIAMDRLDPASLVEVLTSTFGGIVRGTVLGVATAGFVRDTGAAGPGLHAHRVGTGSATRCGWRCEGRDIDFSQVRVITRGGAALPRYQDGDQSLVTGIIIFRGRPGCWVSTSHSSGACWRSCSTTFRPWGR